MKNKNIVYHYCSLEAFYSIITTKSFWLFSLDSSNDLEEMTGAKKIIDKVLEEEKYKSIYKPDNFKQEEFYSLSCTSKRDSALHFNKYADNDNGVCIGIDTDVFKKYLNSISQLNSYFSYFFFIKVIYNDKQKEKEIIKYIEEKLRYINQSEKFKKKELFDVHIGMFSEKNKDIKGIDDLLRRLTYTTTLSRFKPKLKTENYIDESETRMLFCKSQFQSYKNLFEDNLGIGNLFNNFYNAMIKSAETLNLDSSPEFKVMSGVIRKYIELKMEAIWDKQPIKEVILGPNCKTEIKEFNEFLEAKGILCKAVESNIKNRK
jgi:hypothetical protein